MKYNFCGWETATIKPINNIYPSIHSPRDLYDALSKIWCAETCAPRMRDRWTSDNWIKSLHDQCESADVEFDFIGTGNIFIKDGKVYRIPKAYQKVQAQRSGLSYPPGNTDIPMQPKCRFCKRKNSCKGCHWCGKCG